MPTAFNIQALVCSAHRLIEVNEGGARITTAELSKRMKISARTLTEYERGTNHPTSMRALLLLLAQLSDNQIVDMVRRFDAEVGTEVGVDDDH